MKTVAWRLLPGALLIAGLLMAFGVRHAPAIGAAPEFTLTPTSLAFDDQLVTTASASKPVTFENTGTTPLTIASIAFVTGGDNYTQTNNCPVSPATLAVAATCTINVTFAPASVGNSHPGRLRVSPGAVTPQDVTMTGDGIPPAFSLTPPSLNFGNQVATTTSAPQPFTLTNNSTIGLTVTDIEFVTGGEPFAHTTTCPASPTTLAPSASCTIDVTFTPPSVAGFSGTLRVHTAFNIPRDVGVQGTGIPHPFSLTPASHNFGSVTVGATSAAQPFTLTNNSNGTLTIQSIQFTGGAFGQANNCAGGVAAAATCTINVTFSPTAAGPTGSAALRVTDTSGNVRESTLAGTGVLPSPSPSPSPPQGFQVALTVTGNCQAALTQAGPYAANIVVIVQATFDAATTVLVGWTLDGVFVGWANPIDFSIAGSNHTLTATCAPRPTFGDLQQNDPAHETIIQLAARGYIRGYANGNFGSGDPVQRAQMAALIARAMPAGPGTPPGGLLSPPNCLVAGSWDCEDWGTVFTDQGGIDPNLWRNAGTLQHHQVAFGYTAADCAAKGRAFPCYGPTDPVSYAQTVAFITRAMQAKGYWTAQPNAPLPYNGVPSVLATEVRTFHFYTGGVPAAPTDWNGGASRGWFARALWAALDAHWGTDRVH